MTRNEFIAEMLIHGDKSRDIAIVILGLQKLSDIMEEEGIAPWQYMTDIDELLAWRGIYPVNGDKPCIRCSGSGVRTYANTTLWRGGVGGQALCEGICDRCWGSGREDKPWLDLRKIEKR